MGSSQEMETMVESKACFVGILLCSCICYGRSPPRCNLRLETENPPSCMVEYCSKRKKDIHFTWAPQNMETMVESKASFVGILLCSCNCYRRSPPRCNPGSDVLETARICCAKRPCVSILPISLCPVCVQTTCINGDERAGPEADNIFILSNVLCQST